MDRQNDRELKRKLTELKRTHGKAIAVERRATWHKFLKGGLFDELHIVVQPVIAGTGDKLCEGRLDKVKLQLAKEKKLKGGLLKLEYRKAGL
jgi:riboflavin biosynthesis pyrimidine reductase